MKCPKRELNITHINDGHYAGELDGKLVAVPRGWYFTDGAGLLILAENVEGTGYMISSADHIYKNCTDKPIWEGSI